MFQSTTSHCVLVPVLGGDITPAALALASDALGVPGARLAIVHVACACPRAHEPPDAERPRWRRLADALPAERVFVDTVRGDPATLIPAQARRFGCDSIVLGRAPWQQPHSARLDRLVSRLLRGVPGRLLLAVDGDDAERPVPTAHPTRSSSTIPRPARRHHVRASRTTQRQAPALAV